MNGVISCRNNANFRWDWEPTGEFRAWNPPLARWRSWPAARALFAVPLFHAACQALGRQPHCQTAGISPALIPKIHKKDCWNKIHTLALRVLFIYFFFNFYILQCLNWKYYRKPNSGCAQELLCDKLYGIQNLIFPEQGLHLLTRTSAS